MPAPLDITDRRFGKLIVVDRAPTVKKKTRWNCHCDCGNDITTATVLLTHGGKTSCGCDTSERRSVGNQTHGMSRSKTYKSWMMMKVRCLNPSYTHYQYYGGRGIGICEEWTNSFETFLRDMGERPEGLTLDRIDTDKDYCKKNCKWSTRAEQVDNRRNRVILEHDGLSMWIKDWAKVLKIPRSAIYLAIYTGATFAQFIDKRGLQPRVDEYKASMSIGNADEPVMHLSTKP